MAGRNYKLLYDTPENQEIADYLEEQEEMQQENGNSPYQQPDIFQDYEGGLTGGSRMHHGYLQPGGTSYSSYPKYQHQEMMGLATAGARRRPAVRRHAMHPMHFAQAQMPHYQMGGAYSAGSMSAGRRHGGIGKFFKDVGHALAPVGRALAPIGREIYKEAKPVLREVARDTLKEGIKSLPLLLAAGRHKKHAVRKPRMHHMMHGGAELYGCGGAMSAGAMSGGKKSRARKAPSARGAIVAKVMKEYNLTLPQASSFVKQHNLY